MAGFEEYLEKEYRDKEMSVRELISRTKYKKSLIYNHLNKLAKKNKLTKISTGIYKLKKEELPRISDEINTLSKKMERNESRKFKFTALSILSPFIHHIPYSIIYSLYVETGSGEDFKELISRISPKITTIVNPKKDEILLLLKETGKSKIIAIRENNYFYCKERRLAHFDTAFVDLYFEATRNLIPFMNSDLKEILKDLILKDLINYSRMIRYAHERKLTPEIKKLFLNLSDTITIPRGGLNLLRKIP